MLQKIKSFLFKNTSTKQTVAKNTIWLTISQFGGRLIKSGIIIYAARILGTAEYGVFSYAVTLAGFMSLFMDPGVNSVLVREIAKSPEEDRRKIFSTVLVIKLALIALGVGIIIFIGPYFSTLPGAKMLLPIAAFILMFDTLREFFLSLVRGIEKMEWDAGIFLLTNVAIVAFGFAYLFISPTARSLAFGYAIGTGVGALLAVFVLFDYIRDTFKRFSARLIRPILQSAWPFAITGALGLLFTNTDILIISWMKTASDVGIYSAAIRIVQILYLIPGIVQTTTLPLFARLAKQDNARFRAVLEQTVSITFLASIPMAIGGIILGTQILSFLFGPAFASGSLAYKLLMATLIVDFPGAIIVNAIFVYNHQKSLIITSAIGGISNVLLDIFLIPRWGMTGSAVATLIAQTISNGYLWYVMKGIEPFVIFPHLKKILAASVAMGVVTLSLMLLHANVVVNIIVSIVVYVLALRILREKILREVKGILFRQMADTPEVA
jgi:O-antigen/teichoic acid export membrane protein